MSTNVQDVINRDINSLLNTKSTSSTTDISKASIGSAVSSDKAFTSASKNKTSANVFGVYETKQVVKELSASTNSAFSTELIATINTDKLKAIANKLGVSVSSDNDFDSALTQITTNITSLKQKSFSSTSALLNNVTTTTSSDTNAITPTQESIILDSNVSSIIPTSMSAGDFNILKELFSSSDGLNVFSTCDDLNNILSWNNSIISTDAVYAALRELYRLLGINDINGILNCIASVQDSLSIIQRRDLVSSLISSGAVNSLSDLTSSGTNSTIVDTQATVISLTSNSSSYTSEKETSMDTLLTNIGVDKTDVFSIWRSGGSNDSILNQVEDPIYDRSTIKSSDNRDFMNYCFGDTGTDSLISTIPDSLFT